MGPYGFSVGHVVHVGHVVPGEARGGHLRLNKTKIPEDFFKNYGAISTATATAKTENRFWSSNKTNSIRF